MPGKKENAGSYSFMTKVRLHREVAVVDVVSQSAIEAIPEAIPLATDEDDTMMEGVSIGRNNELEIGVLFPTAITSVTVQVFVNMAGDLAVSNGWAKVTEETLAISAHISLRHVYPADCKVLVTALAGTGTVQIVYSKSA